MNVCVYLVSLLITTCFFLHFFLNTFKDALLYVSLSISVSQAITVSVSLSLMVNLSDVFPTFLDSCPTFLSFYLTCLPPTFKLYLLLLQSLSFSLCLRLHTDPLISSQQWLGFTFEITCHASHSPCLPPLI